MPGDTDMCDIEASRRKVDTAATFPEMSWNYSPKRTSQLHETLLLISPAKQGGIVYFIFSHSSLTDPQTSRLKLLFSNNLKRLLFPLRKSVITYLQFNLRAS